MVKIARPPALPMTLRYGHSTPLSALQIKKRKKKIIDDSDDRMLKPGVRNFLIFLPVMSIFISLISIAAFFHERYTNL
jgi:hypothetical protein